MEVDVARPAATFDYELASKEMILAPSDERAKGMYDRAFETTAALPDGPPTEDARGRRSTPISVVCCVYDYAFGFRS